MGRTFCHSTKCLILYHFVLCTWCCFTNYFRRLSKDILLTTWVFNVSAFLVSAIAIDRYISVFFSNENVIKRSKEKNAFMLQCYKPLYTIIINYICKWLEHRTVRYFYTLPFDNFISYINKDNDVCYIYYQFTTGSVFP